MKLSWRELLTPQASESRGTCGVLVSVQSLTPTLHNTRNEQTLSISRCWERMYHDAVTCGCSHPAAGQILGIGFAVTIAQKRQGLKKIKQAILNG